MCRDARWHSARCAKRQRHTQTHSSTQRNVSKYFIRAATAAAAIAICVLFADIVGSRVYKELNRAKEDGRACVCVRCFIVIENVVVVIRLVKFTEK